MIACPYQMCIKTYVWNTKGGSVEWNAVVTRLVTSGYKKSSKLPSPKDVHNKKYDRGGEWHTCVARF